VLITNLERKALTMGLEQNPNTYLMTFRCSNCGHKMVREIPMGEPARGHGGTCGYCGCKDSSWYLDPQFTYSFPTIGDRLNYLGPEETSSCGELWAERDPVESDSWTRKMFELIHRKFFG